MRRILFLLLLSPLLCPSSARAQADSVSAPADKKPSVAVGHQLRFSFDISKPVMNQIQDHNKSYEGAIDYYIGKEVYGVLEGGAGTSVYDYPDLSYKSSNTFFRLGVDKTLIKRLNGNDWDAVFIGARYGIAFIDRGEASYVITDSLWGTTSGAIPSSSFTAHWVEVTGGVRVELLRNLMAGWNVSARFLMNERSFDDLSPSFIAGYGKGDKGIAFGFNFYVCYALRWR